MTALTQLLGQSPAIAAIRDQVGRLLRPGGAPARRLPPILILGETGTGKGLLAAAIHGASGRSGGPFVDVNCAAIPETLLEAELFGFERGAFTDARQAKAGLFQTAGGGTIFLDEIGLLPIALQSKLLKVIEERQVRRLGGTRPEPLDVAVVAATSEDLPAAVAQGRFRPDLYHRLAVVTLTLPPLHERGDDIVLLAEHFLARACEDYGLTPRSLTEDARAALRAHPWPGNVRELANVLERAALLADGPVIGAAALDLPAPRTRSPQGDGASLPGREAEDSEESAAERQALLDVLLDTAWNYSRAAARLGIPRNTLRYRAERLGLRPEAPAGRRRGGRPPRTAQPPAPPRAEESWTHRRITLLGVQLLPRGDRTASELGRALEVTADKVRTFGGRVEELSQASLIAAFGVDIPEEAPRRAAHAAVTVQKRAAQARAEDPGRPGVKVALHTESVPLTRGAGAARIDAGAWQRARARLEALLAGAGADMVVASAEAVPFLTRRFELAALEAGDAATWRLVGHAEPGVTRFVGRDRELRVLAERFELAQAGQGQVVLVAGEPGIGKSRLLRELRRRLGAGVAWIEGQALPFGQAMPFHPVIDMLRRTYRIDEGDSEAAIVDKLERTVLALGEDLRFSLAFLRELMGVDPGDEGVRRMDPKLRRAGIVEATHRLLERAAERHPHVVVVEDAHWVDAATEEWLARLGDLVAAKRVLVLLTCRPGYRSPFGDRSYHTRIALTPLTAGDTHEVARSALGVRALPREVQALVAGKAEGNPFFVEEVLRALQQVGALRRRGEELVLTRPLDEIAVPDTVEDLILARIDRLPPHPRSTLQVAAVIGREFGRRLLERVVEQPAALEATLGELKAAELIHDRQLFPEMVHVFKHALTHEVAYRSLPEARRRELHGCIGAALEELLDERAAEQAPLLAHHFSCAERRERALRWLEVAAAQATQRFAIRESLALYDQALHAAERLGDRRSAARVHMSKSVLHFVVSDFEQSRLEAERWLGVARELGDRDGEARALAAMAWAKTWARDLDGAVADARRAIDLAGPAGAEAVLARSHFTIGFVRAVTGGLEEAGHHLERARLASTAGDDPVHLSLTLSAQGLMRSWEGAFVEATTLQTEAVEIARRHELLHPLLFGFFLRGLSLTGRGDYRGALADFHEGLRLAEKVGDEAIHHRLLNCLGWLHLELGDLVTAADLNERSAEVGRRRADPGTQPNAELNLGEVFLARGDLALARDLFDGVERYAENPGTSAWMRYRYTMRLAAGQGQLALARGDLDGARRHAERCLEAASRVGARKNLVKGWRLLGEVATARRQWEAAGESLRQALDLAHAIGNPGQLWQTWAAVARLEAARGRDAEATRARTAGRQAIDAVARTLQEPALIAGLERVAAREGL